MRVVRDARDLDFAGVCPFHGDCRRGPRERPRIVARYGASLDRLPEGHEAFGDHRQLLGPTRGERDPACCHRKRIVFGGGVMKNAGLGFATIRGHRRASLLRRLREPRHHGRVSASSSSGAPQPGRRGPGSSGPSHWQSQQRGTGHDETTEAPHDNASAARLASVLELLPPLALVGTREAQPTMSCDARELRAARPAGTRIVSASQPCTTTRAPGRTACCAAPSTSARARTANRTRSVSRCACRDGWNGRYFDQVNGGNDGAVVPAYGNLGGNQPDNALARGYAMLSSDSGHDGQANRDAGLIGGNLFGFDHQARLDYGYAANVTLTPLAKTIVERYYGRRPEYSYMVGCSNGGRHALVGATRLANEFDGFLAGAPGYNLPQVALQHAWDVQSFAQADGDVPRAFSRDDMRLVADGVVAAVRRARRRGGRHRRRDRGMPANVRSRAPARASATAQRSVPRAAASRGAEALVRAARRTRAAAALLVVAVRRGPGLERLAQLEAREPDPGVRRLAADRDARRGLARADLHDAADDASPARRRALLAYLRSFDFDRDAPKIDATTPEYPFARWTSWRRPIGGNPQLAELKAAGGKLIVYHGASDGAFSLQATIDWYDKLRANNGGDVGALARFYPVPGMTHCGGGPATDRFDLFTPLVDWVEHGKAPAAVTASARARQPRAAARLEPDALAPALRLAEGRALSRNRRSRIRGELPLRMMRFGPHSSVTLCRRSPGGDHYVSA